MLNSLRRVITGHDARGRSIIEHDGPPANVIEANGAGLAEIWTADRVPAPTANPEDPAAGEVRLEPPEGGVKVRWFSVAPEPDGMSAEEREEAAAFGFAAVHASHARVDTSRHPMMHKTETLDYIILLKGEVTLLVDEGEVDLKPGDVVVQRATNHAWVNKGSEPALLIAVLIDGESS
ncbi:MAG: cupin domain-containing protein [Alphaproteobacteria bacterium]